MTSITETYTLDEIRNLKSVFLADAVKAFLPKGSSKLSADEKREALADLWAKQTNDNFKVNAEQRSRETVIAEAMAEAGLNYVPPTSNDIMSEQLSGRIIRDINPIDNGQPLVNIFQAINMVQSIPDKEDVISFEGLCLCGEPVVTDTMCLDCAERNAKLNRDNAEYSAAKCKTPHANGEPCRPVWDGIMYICMDTLPAMRSSDWEDERQSDAETLSSPEYREWISTPIQHLDPADAVIDLNEEMESLLSELPVKGWLSADEKVHNYYRQMGWTRKLTARQNRRIRKTLHKRNY